MDDNSAGGIARTLREIRENALRVAEIARPHGPALVFMMPDRFGHSVGPEGGDDGAVIGGVSSMNTLFVFPDGGRAEIIQCNEPSLCGAVGVVETFERIDDVVWPNGITLRVRGVDVAAAERLFDAPDRPVILRATQESLSG